VFVGFGAEGVAAGAGKARGPGTRGSADDVDEEPVGSIRFVGFDEMDRRFELFADARGKRFNLLDLYRHGRVDGGALFADAVSQLEAAGRR